jgi:hypothetical protein
MFISMLLYMPTFVDFPQKILLCILYTYIVNFDCPHRRCLHLIVVVGFECSWDPESYASGSVATGSVTHAGQVKE